LLTIAWAGKYKQRQVGSASKSIKKSSTDMAIVNINQHQKWISISVNHSLYNEVRHAPIHLEPRPTTQDSKIMEFGATALWTAR
jgi:hypothetical protein